MTLLSLGGDEVIAIVADEPLPQSIRPGHHATAIAAAVVLGRDAGAAADAPPALAVLQDLRQAPPLDGAERPEEVDGPCAAILPLIAALTRGQSGRVAVSPTEDPRWTIDVRDAREVG
jgi:hypothetical protein